MQAKTGFRPKRSARWRTGVLLGVHLLIIAHVTHWLVNGTTLAGIGPAEAMDLPKHDIINVGLLVFAATILATAVFGRFFCGWGCHLVALQDFCRWLLMRAGIRPRPLRSRLLGLVPFIAFAYMFLWPAAYRLYVGDEFLGFEFVWTTSNLWVGLPGWTIGILTLLFCGFVIVYVLGSKGFCTYACPYGAIFGMAEQFAPLRVRVTDDCQSCARCTAACTSNVRVHEHVRDFKMVIDRKCMKCLDCVGSCPTGALHLGFGRPAVLARPRVEGAKPPHRWNVSWPEELLLGVLFAGAFFTFRGLYGKVPFLMSLGVSGIMAFLSLVLVRLVTWTDLRFGGWRLRRGGRMTGAGWLFSGLMIVTLVLWFHSAFVRFHDVVGTRLFQQTTELRTAALDLDSPLYVAQDEDLELVVHTIETLGRAERWGFFANPRTPLKLAWMHLLAGNKEEFGTQIGAALQAQPGSAEVHMLRARSLVATRRFGEALEAYGRAVECKPNTADAYLSLGTLLAGLGDLEHAIEVFDRGITVLPDNADLHYNSGVAHALRGEIESAVLCFEEALAINPEHHEARENLAGLLALGSSQ